MVEGSKSTSNENEQAFQFTRETARLISGSSIVGGVRSAAYCLR